MHTVEKIIIPLITFAFGSLITIFVQRKKLKLEQQDVYEKMMRNIENLASDYIIACLEYLKSNIDDKFDYLTKMDIAANKYFIELALLCDRFNEGLLNKKTNKITLSRKIESIVSGKIIEQHYEMMENQTGNKGQYLFNENDHRTIYNAYNEFKKYYDSCKKSKL
jgi:hypothetical protein